ncbi:MAG: energy transducer TonB [Gammaproteobacteria bacterium]|nr:energy transducer TonB [Gammaproteobacteria bacterium]MBK79497.1 energy transducer TonB [Gammaproteobacteria bacterium]MBK80691.1 energy transducer TonB [Gammaproteobacteria bacterium]
MAAATITPRDRLGFTLFLALSLHAAVILGVGFVSEDSGPPVPTIEVTLAHASEPDAPEDADFIAQANQQGSGTEAEALETTTTTEADFQSDRIQPVTPAPVPVMTPETRRQRELLSAATAAEEQVTAEETLPTERADATLIDPAASYDDLARQIASLEARIAADEQALAKRPRVKRLTSVSTKSADEAAYLNAWRQKVERIGNANYPGGNVYGNLRLLVVLRYDGALEEVRLLESSGHKVLDDAALRIVRLAAPYQDFPVEMRKKYDRLEIIRTWQFSRTGTSLDT